MLISEVQGHFRWSLNLYGSVVATHTHKQSDPEANTLVAYVKVW